MPAIPDDPHSGTRHDLEEIQRILAEATRETEKALDSLSPGGPKVRFREGIMHNLLQYIVQLDMDMAGVHQLRQRILASQPDVASPLN